MTERYRSFKEKNLFRPALLVEWHVVVCTMPWQRVYCQRISVPRYKEIQLISVAKFLLYRRQTQKILSQQSRLSLLVEEYTRLVVLGAIHVVLISIAKFESSVLSPSVPPDQGEPKLLLQREGVELEQHRSLLTNLLMCLIYLYYL
jgi:hypothetical protein